MTSAHTLCLIVSTLAVSACLMTTPAFAGISFFDGTFDLNNYGLAQIWSSDRRSWRRFSRSAAGGRATRRKSSWGSRAAATTTGSD